MSKLTAPVSSHDHTQGKAYAPWTLVEYGDYQCPSCSDAHPIVKQLQQHFGDQLRFVFRHFPLEMHPYAEHAAEAAEFASAHSKFWEMHDLLFENQASLKDASLLKLAARLRLSTDQLKHALQEHKYASRIQTDLESGEASGLTGTPTFYINSVMHQGAYDFDTLAAAIEATTKLKSGN